MATFNQQYQKVNHQYNAETINFTISQDNLDFANHIEGLKQVTSDGSKELKTLIKLVKSGNIQGSLQHLQSMEKIIDSDTYESVLVLNARYGRVKKSQTEGTIDSSEYNLENNKIFRSILEILTLIENKQ